MMPSARNRFRMLLYVFCCTTMLTLPLAERRKCSGNYAVTLELSSMWLLDHTITNLSCGRFIDNDNKVSILDKKSLEL